MHTAVTKNIECHIENKFDIDDIKKNAKSLMAGITMCAREDFEKIRDTEIKVSSLSLLSTLIFAVSGFVLCRGDLNDKFLTGLLSMFFALIVVCVLFCSVWTPLYEKKFSNALRRTLEADLEKAGTLEEILVVTRTLQRSFISYKGNTKFEHDIFDLSMLNERLEDYLTLTNKPVLHTDFIGNTLHFDIKDDGNVVVKKEIHVNLVKKLDAAGYTLLFENWEMPTLVCKYYMIENSMNKDL